MEDKVVIESTSLTEMQARIYLVRGVQVMIDRDLALLYGVENRSLRQAVRRNSEMFPEVFLLKLIDEESNDMITKGVSQTMIPPGYNTGGMQMIIPFSKLASRRRWCWGCWRWGGV